MKELEIENGKKENSKFYKKLEILTKMYKPRNNNIKAPDGSVLPNEKWILNRWNENLRGEKSKQQFEFYENESYDNIDEGIVEPTLYEIREIVRNLKRSKTPGTDNINAELLQVADPQMTQRIEELILNIWRSEKFLINGTNQ